MDRELIAYLDGRFASLLQVLIAKAPFLQRTRPKILDNDVAFCGELPEQLPTAVASEIQRHALLVTGFREPYQRIAALGVGAEAPERMNATNQFISRRRAACGCLARIAKQSGNR